MPWLVRNVSSLSASWRIPSVTIGPTIGDYIEIKAAALAGNLGGFYQVIGNQSGFSNLIELRTSEVAIRASGLGASFGSGYVQPAVGVVFTLRITKTSSTQWQASLNGVNIGSPQFLDRNMVVDAISAFNSNTTGVFRGDLYYVAFSTNGGASATRYYDADASGGSGTTLPDTAGGDAATQFGTWPADNSEWVFYSSGDNVSSSVAATWPMLSVSATQSQSVSGVTSSVAAAWPMLAVSATQSQSIPSVSSSVAVSWPMFSVSANQSQATGFVSSVSVTWPMFNVSAAQSQTVPPVSMSVSATWPLFVVSAVQSEPGFIPPANSGAYVIQAYVGGTETISAKIGGRQTINAMVAI